VTVSAGNHAQAVAWASRLVGAPCVVVMPASAPRSKLDAVRGYGAEVVLHEDRATLFDRLREVERERGLTFVHPFDDPAGLAGAGTLGLEIVEDVPELDVVVVPIGGGGLMAGVTVAVKELRPKTRVYGVELAEGPGMGPALAAGKPVPAPRPPNTIADGLTPPFVGEIPLAVARDRLDGIVAVRETEILAAMRWLMSRAKLVVEGSGAAATAALLAGRVPGISGARVVSVVSGGNVDPERLEALVEEAQV
jgi:threonine dehydratase